MPIWAGRRHISAPGVRGAPRATLVRVAQARRSGEGAVPTESTPATTTGTQQAVATTAAGGDDYFLEPLLRSFLLGVGAGAIVETTHVLFKAFTIAAESGPGVMDALPGALPEFAPLFVWDHVAAVGAWVLLYAVEAIAILSVLNQYPDDSKKADRTIRRMVTVTKRMLPLKLSALKRALYTLTGGRSARAATAVAAALPALTSAPTAVDASSAAPLAFRDGGAATLERIREELEAEAAAAPRLPRASELPKPKKSPGSTPTPQSAGRLAERRRSSGLRPGQLDPAAAPPLSRREQELIDRKSYLRNFWYAAALSSNLTDDKPLGVDILGGRLVLFRDQETGEVRCLDDWCPHRGAPLSGGEVKVEPRSGHTCVVCPYHGHAFDAEGRLQDVPSAEPGRWPKRPLVSSFPVVESGGFVWLFFGDLPEDLRPPIPASFMPELDDPKWHAVYGEVEFDCGHWGVFENAIDMAHIHYLHGDSFGNQDHPRIHGMTATQPSPYHVESQFRIHNKPMNKIWEWTNTGDSVPVTARAFLPSTSAVTIELAHGVSMITFVNTVPITETRSINRFCLIRNFLGWDGFDDYARSQMFKILGEDKVMVEKLRPDALDFEYSLGPDGPQVAFRKLRDEWVKMGYASRYGLGRAPTGTASRQAADL